ncbi:MAG TPA: alpha-glucuronidase family glycosyl hydrolase [Puia sp.]|uniref:alpha-glucuronidase family glycosyl hydrolase n=1 Tax=Puia sp. TaxID=2045100 RepID=UPI002B755E50|nr:alpha-glucuronidase family glycosyl hydrolase [Puia sp.]HVU98562.1 alpha-glucuronidase family glycosyl hydrolase [Puia sp.]
MKNTVLLGLFLLLLNALQAEDGYRLWLRYDLIGNKTLLQQYRSALNAIAFPANTPMLAAARQELLTGLQGLLGQTPRSSGSGNTFIVRLEDQKDRSPEGFTLRTAQKDIVLTASTEKGILYGIFHFLRLLQTQQPIDHLDITSNPTLPYRILDHWDNLNRRVERGYAGLSLWDWFTLPTYKDQRYTDYARANASIGINGTVLNNVNASPYILTPDWLEKAASLADIFRPYGIRVYLSVRFSSPMDIGGLHTADPLDPAVREWWRKKADEIYRYIPDFGGFLVKANSEGQPGPQNYGRTHADGANMLAEALEPHRGIVIWRAFVYSNETPEDRARQAYTEFKPLDGKFHKNVLLQVKNGPIDFQPREPFHPLFGAMPDTPLLLEVQLTQEYLGFSSHLVYLAPLFEECLDADTHQPWPSGSTGVPQTTTPVSTTIRGMAGVANIGNDRNWCGHIFAQANWYAFGRLAWETGGKAAPYSAAIATEWIRQTFTNDPKVVDSIKEMMMASREIAVNYMTPLGLHHIMAYEHHYGPGPWLANAKRADWNPVYYHKADTAGVGFDRTPTGSNALEQYAPGARSQWADSNACPDQWLLWWHHVSWNHRMHTGRTLWAELCRKYYAGVDSVRWMQRRWNALRPAIDPERWQQVDMRLAIQEKNAVEWRNACLLYFQTFSRQPLPETAERPDHTLEYYQQHKIDYAPGTNQ